MPMCSKKFHNFGVRGLTIDHLLGWFSSFGFFVVFHSVERRVHLQMKHPPYRFSILANSFLKR